MASHPCIQRKSDNAVLATTTNPEQVLFLEDNWYFHPDTIDTSRFEISNREYICSYKGTCYWVDLKTEDGHINDVAWMYPDPKPGFRKIKGWFGFYADHRYYRFSDCP
jgi:uncharacterized protein (DUF427 family)